MKEIKKKGGTGPRQKVVMIKVEQRPSSSAAQPEIDSWTYEDEESKGRDPEKDIVLFKQACDEISRLMKELLDLKKQKNSSAEIAEKKIQVCMLFITLKKLNRLEKLKSKSIRDGTFEAKQRVDNFHLQLQNLLYESLHLKKEVDKCLEFKSKDEEIELVPPADFYRDAPKEICKAEITRNDAHQQMLARLDWELEQRKRLAKQCEESMKLKENIASEIRGKCGYLENLSPRLRSILEATKPLQDYLGMPLEAKRTQHRMAYSLPRPLFILYFQTTAYNEASDRGLTITVEGDPEEAKMLMNSLEEPGDEDSGDSDQDESGEQRHRRRTIDSRTNARKKLLQKHPLSVSIIIKCTDGASVQLQFLYMIKLHIVTVNVSFKSLQPSMEGNTWDILSMDSLLCGLFPNDYGHDTPNPANHYQLRKLGLGEFSSYIAEIGLPYVWVQRLAGLEFMQDEGTRKSGGIDTSLLLPPAAESGISASHVERTISRIQSRVRTRLMLYQQICSLTRGLVPGPTDGSNLFPGKISSRLVGWKCVSLEDPLIAQQCQRLIDENLMVSGGMTFLTHGERGSAKLRAVVNIDPNYPRIAPVFSLNVTWKFERTPDNDDSLRAMEQELNMYCHEMSKERYDDQLLIKQVQQLLVCFDIYLETETANGSVEGPVEFPKEKIFLRCHRGRNRSKPFKYISRLGLYTHRT